MAGAHKSLIVVVSAPSGSGKTTIVSRVLEALPRIRRSISYTTRPPRPGEKDGADYLFISEEAFRKKIKNNDFLEWEENFGNYYGTDKGQITNAQEEGVDIVLSIDVKGAQTVRQEFPDSISVFIMPPSFGELETRLRGRNTDAAADLDVRLKEAEKEMRRSDDYDYLIVNDDLDTAVEELKAIIEQERANRVKQKR
jgi:guanylate kinase